MPVASEMPRYRSHKTVWALEIEHADQSTGMLTFKESNYSALKAPAEMWSRYQPVKGDFYVQYADGYTSFSPRKAFLEGYIKE